MAHLPDPAHQPEFYATVPTKRFFAWIFDTVVILLLSLIAVVLTAFVGAFVWPVLYLVVGFIYRTATIANGSATWGMRFVGLELRNAWGQRMDAGQAIAHTAGYTISMAIPVLQVISVIMMLTSSRAQGLTDAVLGTVALNRRAGR
ncbi:RDD family protein [Lutimaribacter marinistellae]|uniref:RDD family protein n=1 Tax=Lutimaribacter marinistellae TaxID=1820329 RepID=A0ABV7TJN0_9RHOB